MTEPMISWREGWVSEWDGNVLVCVRADKAVVPQAPDELAKEVAKAIPSHWPAGRMVVTAVCAEYGLTYSKFSRRQVNSNWHSEPSSWPRYDAVTRLRALQKPDGSPRYSLPDIARMVGFSNHTSVLLALSRWKEITAWIDAFDTDAKREAVAA